MTVMIGKGVNRKTIGRQKKNKKQIRIEKRGAWKHGGKGWGRFYLPHVPISIR